ncbi:protein kinase [Paenibacillus illinoisensis]|uniref:protein kinase domain-containing protein n=1 Tax=Paenibacillus illinoisensis TaxID=59845 RepID=UPI0036F30443
MPYGQEGREGTVYKLINSSGESSALKVFRPAFRQPSIMKLTELVADLTVHSGLRVWSRTILNPLEDMELLGQYPELLYGAHMPWIDGVTWSEFMLGREALSREQSLKMATGLVSTMAVLEQAGIAHADLSASNVLIINPNEEAKDLSVELVDVEGMYAKQLEEPDNLPEGTTGYTATFLRDYGDWSPLSDRFAGGVLLAEMLAWSSTDICKQAWGDSYFDPQEIQQQSERYVLLQATLEQCYGSEVAALLERLWNAEQLQQCPTFGEWQIALVSAKQFMEEEVVLLTEMDIELEQSIEDSNYLPSEYAVNALSHAQENQLARARQLERKGNLTSAFWEYGKLIEQFNERSPFHVEITIAMEQVQEGIDQTVFNPEPKQTLVKKGWNQLIQQNKQSTYDRMWIYVIGGSVGALVFALIVYVIGLFK